MKSYLLATLSALTLGTANFLIEHLSIKLGAQVVYAQSFGNLFSALAYYAFMYGKFYIRNQKKDQKDRRSYFTRSTSQYYEVFIVEDEMDDGRVLKREEYRFCIQRLMCPIYRMLNQLAIQFVIFYCFSYCVKAGMNGGVVSSIFAMSLVFTILIFSLPMYGQKVSRNDIIGAVLILACVIGVGLGPMITTEKEETGDSSDAPKDDGLNMLIAIVMAVGVGILFTI